VKVFPQSRLLKMIRRAEYVSLWINLIVKARRGFDLGVSLGKRTSRKTAGQF